MLQLPSLFDNQLSYQDSFIAGLKKMLMQSDELGVFILVLANATYDQNIYADFKDELKQKFSYFEQLFKNNTDHNQLGAPDDVIVFEQLLKLGFENCGINQVRQEGLWKLQFNPLRSYRPARSSQAHIADMNQEFDHSGFNFNKPFLVKEELWQGYIGDKHCRILYNKFPFADSHTLLVIDSKKNKNQWLEKEDITFLRQLSKAMTSLPSLQISYNSIGAYASINHQHFQLSLNDDSVIEHKKWRHNGGDKEYCLPCIKLEDSHQAWQVILDLQMRNIAFNFLFKCGVMYIISRLKQGEYEQPIWTTGFGWADVFGLFSISDEMMYRSLISDTIELELIRLKV